MKGYDINKIVESVLSYSERHNRKVTIAYLLIPGLNDKATDVRQLGRWFREKNVLIIFCNIMIPQIAILTGQTNNN